MAVDTFSVNDMDAAISLGARYFYDHRLKPIGRALPFSLDFTVGRLSGMTAGLLRYGSQMEVSVGGLDHVYGVNVPLRGNLDLRFGTSEVAVSPGLAAVVSPVSRKWIRGFESVDDRTFLLKFERPVLEAELRRLLDRDIVGPIEFQPVMDLRIGRGAQWWQFLRALVAALESPGGLAFNPLLSASLSSTIMSGLLLASEHKYRDELEAPPKRVRSEVIQRAVTIMEERAYEPLSIPGIAAEVGCSVRALQLGFNRYMDVSPSRYLSRVRMDRAHRELVTGTPESTSVGEVASRWGFHQAGRFAADYRALYGTTPSKTLRGR